MVKRYLLTFSYDATNYYGYQRQPKLKTVQQTMEEALTKINNNHKVVLYASSRTDQGVHALKQMAHCDIEVNITPYKLKRAMNSNLPEDIHVSEVKEVNKDFHARYLTIKKQYVYTLNMGIYNPLERNFVNQYGKDLDINKMKEAIKYLIGKHDFTSFVSAEDPKKDKVREIYEATIEQDGQKVFISFVGDGFLKYQVRNMVGTLIEVGSGQREPDDIKKILLATDRQKAGKTAKPEGLCLMNIWYK